MYDATAYWRNLRKLRRARIKGTRIVIRLHPCCLASTEDLDPLRRTVAELTYTTLYTNNKLTLAVGVTLPPDHGRRYRIAPVVVGAEPYLVLNARRGTGYYKVPSLRGAVAPDASNAQAQSKGLKTGSTATACALPTSRSPFLAISLEFSSPAKTSRRSSFLKTL